MSLARQILMIIGLAVTSACVGTGPIADREADLTIEPVLANVALFVPTAPAPTPEELVGLSDSQARAFLAYFHHPVRADEKANDRIRNYLEQELKGFDYVGETLSVSESLDRHAGNCMSLAALTLALSRLAGVEMDFQLVNTPPVFDRDDQMIVSSDHVRSRLYDSDYQPTEDHLVLQRPHIRVDYFADREGIGGRRIAVNTFLAMFYRNLAAEALFAGDPDRSFTLVREAMNRDPDQPDFLNLLAVLHRRAGDSVTAEAYFRYGLARHGDQVDLLSNYADLLLAQGREDEAALMERRYAAMNDPNPFHWLELGERARQNGRPAMALQWYRRALERAPYLHEAYWRSAIAYREMGRIDESIRALEQAIDRSYRVEVEERYQAKIHALRSVQAAESWH